MVRNIGEVMARKRKPESEEQYAKRLAQQREYKRRRYAEDPVFREREIQRRKLRWRLDSATATEEVRRRESKRRNQWRKKNVQHARIYYREYYAKHRAELARKINEARRLRNPAIGLKQLCLDFKRGTIQVTEFIERIDAAVAKSTQTNGGKT